MVIIVDVYLLAREELLTRERSRRTPVLRGLPRTLLANKTPQSLEKLGRRNGRAVHDVFRFLLASQQRREVVQNLPIRREIQTNVNPRCSVDALDPVRGMPGRNRARPPERTFGCQRKTNS
jgi:hypothetical protein